MGNFILYNRHPDGKTVGDCVVRAVSTAFNKDYLETRRELNRTKRALNYESYADHYFIYDYLKDFERLTFKSTAGKSRYKLCEFANDHKTGTYVVKVRKHVVAVVDGIILDSWDSSYLTVYTAWKIEPATSLKDLGIDASKAEEKRKRVYL